MAESYSILCIYDFFIHSSVHVHFGYFHVSAIVNAAAAHACMCVLLFSHYYLAEQRQSPQDTQSPFTSLSLWHPPFCFLWIWSQLTVLGALYEWTQTSFVLSFLVYVTEHNALGFIQAVACVRTAFLSGWTTFIVWMDHGLLVHSSVEGHREYLHSSLTSCNICGITSESPMMIQKSFTINYFINFFILKPIIAEKKGRMHVSFTCV